jgi:hypothetical protein
MEEIKEVNRMDTRRIPKQILRNQPKGQRSIAHPMMTWDEKKDRDRPPGPILKGRKKKKRTRRIPAFSIFSAFCVTLYTFQSYALINYTLMFLTINFRICNHAITASI